MALNFAGVRKLWDVPIIRYMLRTGFIIVSTQIAFVLLATQMEAAVANAVALVSMLYPGLWIDKRLVWGSKDRFTWSEIREFLSVSIAPTVISPVAIWLSGDQPAIVHVGISVGVFGVFWVIRFVLHKKRWHET